MIRRLEPLLEACVQDRRALFKAEAEAQRLKEEASAYRGGERMNPKWEAAVREKEEQLEQMRQEMARGAPAPASRRAPSRLSRSLRGNGVDAAATALRERCGLVWFALRCADDDETAPRGRASHRQGLQRARGDIGRRRRGRGRRQSEQWG